MIDTAGQRDSRSNQHLLVAGTAINALGSGMYMPLSVLILAGLSGISLTEIGLYLSVAQVVAMITMPLIGRALDYLGGKVVLISAMVGQGAGFLLYPVLEHAAAFLAVTALIAISNQAGKTARPIVIAVLTRDRDRDRLLALNRSLANAGLGIGGMIFAVSSASSVQAYTTICVVNAATFLVTAVLTFGLRLGPPEPPNKSSRRVGVPRDLPYLGFLGSGIAASLLYTALTVFIPLYVVESLHQSTALAGVLFVINTTIAAIGGVPAVTFMHRYGITRLCGARMGLAMLAVGLGMLPLAHVLPGIAVPGLAVLAMVIYSVGELFHSPTSSALSLTMAPDGQRGRYQAQFQMSMSIGAAIAPATFTFLLEYRPQAGAAFAVVCGVIGILLTAGVREPVLDPERASSQAPLQA